MIHTQPQLNRPICQKARLSRDPRFDGLFFTAVKTTGIYCRSICPATPPKESNVDYYPTAMQAAAAGFRPCLRCRPDSAPHSAAWMGSQALLQRAVRLIEQGRLESESLQDLAAYLGVSDRYLRQLFVKHLGLPPKRYALYQQCLFAKQLLHQTKLPINHIALASGFNSVRRFNDCFKQLIQVTPSQIRQIKNQSAEGLSLIQSYRPPYDWVRFQQFLQHRLIPGLENITADSYGRSFNWNGCQGSFVATHIAAKHAFRIQLQLDDMQQLRPVLNNIRRVLDLDADTQVIEAHLADSLPTGFQLQSGLRIPGIWDVFEAGIRAILGQQVSVQAAKKLVIQLTEQLGEGDQEQRFFPTPATIINSDLAFFNMPGSRKQSLKNLAQHMLDHPDAGDPNSWLALKGIGPWTANYARLRGLSDPDVFLAGDLGVERAMRRWGQQSTDFEPADASPWRSYLTFQLWSQD